MTTADKRLAVSVRVHVMDADTSSPKVQIERDVVSAWHTVIYFGDVVDEPSVTYSFDSREETRAFLRRLRNVIDDTVLADEQASPVEVPSSPIRSKAGL